MIMMMDEWMNEWMNERRYFNKNDHSWSLPSPHDTDDIEKVT